jgi:hypothetical protein
MFARHNNAFMPGIQAQHDISLFQEFEDDGGFAPWIMRHGWHLLFAYSIGLVLNLTNRHPHVNIASGLEKIRSAYRLSSCQMRSAKV